MEWEVLDQAVPTISDHLISEVRAFNQAALGYSDAQPLTVIARDANGQIVAGVSGRTVYRHWLIDVLWVAEDRRSSGLGRQLMERAEQQARKRGCVAAQVDTLSFQAPQFYHKLGFVEIGRVADFPPGHTRYYLCKRY